MWTRAELKERAKGCLRQYYWAAFLVSLIFSIIGGLGGVNIDSESIDTFFHIDTSEVVEDMAEGDFSYELFAYDDWGNAGRAGRMVVPGGGAVSGAAASLITSVFAGAVIVILLVSAIIGIFISPLFDVGTRRFYMESRLAGRSVGIDRILWGFSNGYLKIVKTQFLKNLIPAAVMAGCMAPGIIFLFLGASLNGAIAMLGLILFMVGLMVGSGITIWLEYSFLMVPYILSENPSMKSRDALKLSRQMMEGHKFNTFVLGLSFFGWELLGLMLCGVGILFVQPYVDATFAELYAVLRVPYREQLGGYGYEAQGGYGYGQNNGYGAGYGYGGNAGYGQDNGYGGNAGYGQDNGYGGNNGCGQNNGYGQNSSYGQNSGYGNENGYNQNDGYGNGYDQNSGYGRQDSWQDPQGSGWQQGGGQSEGDVSGQRQASSDRQPEMDERAGSVSRSEGGPGRGYYLNGKFYPYTDEDTKE